MIKLDKYHPIVLVDDTQRFIFIEISTEAYDQIQFEHKDPHDLKTVKKISHIIELASSQTEFIDLSSLIDESQLSRYSNNQGLFLRFKGDSNVLTDHLYKHISDRGVV